MTQEKLILKREEKEILLADSEGHVLLRTYWTLIKDIFINSQWFTLLDRERLEAQLQKAMAMSDEREMVETIIADPFLYQELRDLISPRYPTRRDE